MCSPESLLSSRTLIRRAALAAALLAVAAESGCVHRRVTIRSDPPGALVLLDGDEVGYTPVSVDFTYYGTREIMLIKDGYETLTLYQEIPPPWYQVPPLDFISDNLLPFRVSDRREFSYRLQPQVIVPREEIQDRANRARTQAQLGL